MVCRTSSTATTSSSHHLCSWLIKRILHWVIIYNTVVSKTSILKWNKNQFSRCRRIFIFIPCVCSLSNPDAYITHNATWLPTVWSEMKVCYTSSSLCSTMRHSDRSLLNSLRCNSSGCFNSETFSLRPQLTLTHSSLYTHQQLYSRFSHKVALPKTCKQTLLYNVCLICAVTEM